MVHSLFLYQAIKCPEEFVAHGHSVAHHVEALSCLYRLEVRAMSSAALQYIKGQIVYRSLFFSALNKVIFVVTCNDVIYIITPFSRQESSAADSVLIFGKCL